LAFAKLGEAAFFTPPLSRNSVSSLAKRSASATETGLLPVLVSRRYPGEAGAGLPGVDLRDEAIAAFDAAIEAF
jgi:hypothetical protein